jgi:Cu(I)/Ag(I) efflux system membrane protein CusA/SilA
LQSEDALIKGVPEVVAVLGKAGRAETATDPAPLSMFESIILLKPREQWRPGISKDDLVAELDGKLQQTGVRNGWTQPIINRINMLSTGVRTDLGVKFYGRDLNVLQQLATQAETLLKRVPGAVDVVAERLGAGNYLDIVLDRRAAARFGVNARDLQEVIETALGGVAQTDAMDGRSRFPVRLRYGRDDRDTLEAVSRAMVTGSDGQQVPLALVAQIATRVGPSEISSEGGMLRSLVFLNVRGRDMGGFVADAQQMLKQNLRLPPGYSIAWSGQWESQVRANRRLLLMVPLGLVIIFALLVATFRSAREAGMVMLSVPFALVGGIYLVALLNYHLSVAVWVGFIALYGIAVQTGVVMVIYLHEALARQQRLGPLDEAALRTATYEGAVLRLRPKLMTVAVGLFGLVPIMWSTGTGTDVMRPIAAPMIGGLLTSAVHVLVMTPVIFFLLKRKDLRRGKIG